MSEISGAKAMVYYPAQFPPQGRLPTQASFVGENCHQQDSQERAYRQELCVAANKRVEPPCCKTLHLSLFFDGTGNNLNNDQYIATIKHPTNIARLFRATIGTGYAGGAQKEPMDGDSKVTGKYFKYYIPGVGTPFPEVEDLEYSTEGLAGAAYGEERVNWGLLRLVDMLMRVSGQGKMEDGDCLKSVKAMGTTWALLGLGGSHNRYEEFNKQLKKVSPQLRKAVAPGKPKILGIKLYVYGFSRGAAEARTFVRWLSELLPKPAGEELQPEQCLIIGDLKIPLSIEFLGLLDTVASVGVAHVAPFAEGHMAWADDTQELPDEKTYGGLIKKCVHLVASHEQRLCFPLDSIRRGNGQYPANSYEVVCPGMHSDLGGGYPPKDQGKAIVLDEKGKEDLHDDSLLLSQIALHEMYAAAFAIGAPFKVPQDALPQNLSKDPWRSMTLDVLKHFNIDTSLITRFNAWREVTLGLTPSSEKISDAQAASFNPVSAGMALEKAVANQIGWITAWRINRYAGATLQNTPFYLRATNKDSDPLQLEASKAERKEKQDRIEDDRAKNRAKHREGEPWKPELPGVKDFDPDLARTQLYQAAMEFGEDYRNQWRTRTGDWQMIADTIPQHLIFLINSDDERVENARIKADGDSHKGVMFPSQGEASNATQPSGLLRALFDDQVHDSRAWFLHAKLGHRELWGSYFIDRMIYFGSESSKQISPLSYAGNVIGLATLVGGVIFSFKQKTLAGQLAGLAGTAGMMGIEVQVLDILTKEPLPMLPEAAQLTAFTQSPGAVLSQVKVGMAEQQMEQAKKMIASRWAKAQELMMS